MPISLKDAEAAVNPSLTGEAKQRAVDAIITGVAANDAYLNSRSEIEQAVSLARGGQVAAPHDEREAETDSATAVSKGTGTELAKLEGEAVADAEVVGTDVEKVAESFPGELEVIKKRAQELGLVK